MEAHVPIIMREENTPPEIKKILDDIRKATDAPAPNVFYVAMARWHDLLKDFAKQIQMEMDSPMYDHCKREVRDYAMQLCDELPGPIELTTSQLLDVMDEGEIGSMLRITEAFEDSLSALVLNVAWTRIGLEGGNMTAKVREHNDGEPIAPSAA